MATLNSNHLFQHSMHHSPLQHRRVSLIKRPPLVRSTSPNLSEQRKSSNSKSHHIKNKPKKTVRFHDDASLENVRLFLKNQMPKACSSDPVCLHRKNTFRIRRPNWPDISGFSRRGSRVGSAIRIEDVQLQPAAGNNADQLKTITLLGSVQVANLAFEKHVVIRYTVDDWATSKEVQAQYQEPIAQSANTWDRFSFKIVLTAMHHLETIFLAAKYNVNGREFWDNNDNKNYQVDIVPDVQLDLPDEDLTFSSSDEDDDHTFEDCIDDDDDDDEEEVNASIKSLSLTDNNKKPPSQFAARYNFDSAIEKPWSPPLSPTTPVDSNPLWMPAAESNYFKDDKKEHKQEASPPPSPNQFHNLINKYCFYYDHKRPSIYTQYHSDPPRCSSPTPKAILS